MVDTDGQPFADAALSEREDERQLGANNFWLGPHFVKRLAHLGWGFGPSISALGLKTSFDHNNSPVSVHKTYDSGGHGVSPCSQNLVPDAEHAGSSWNPKGLNIPFRRTFEVFHPQRLRRRHGHHRLLALRPTPGRPGGDTVSFLCSSIWKPNGTARTTILSCSAIRRCGQRSHRPQDPAQSAEERQGLPGSLPLLGGTVAGEMVSAMAGQTVLPVPQLAGYAEELARAELDIAELESRRQRYPGDLEKRVRLAYRLFHRASLTGSMAQFEAVEATILKTILEFGPKEDMCLSQGQLGFSLSPFSGSPTRSANVSLARRTARRSCAAGGSRLSRGPLRGGP